MKHSNTCMASLLLLLLLLLTGCLGPRNPWHRRVGSDRVSAKSLALAEQIDAIDQLIQQGRFQAAASSLEELIEQGQRHPRIVFMQAGLAIQRGEYEQAIPWLEAAIEAAPHWPEPRLSLAQAYLSLQRPGAAGQVFASLQQLFPHHPAGPYGRAWIALLRGQEDLAQGGFDEALKRDPDFAPALLGLAHLAADDRQRAIALWQRYRMLMPLDPRAHYRLAEFDQEAGLWERAERGYKRAWELRPDPQTARALATLARQRGAREEAEEWEQRAQ